MRDNRKFKTSEKDTVANFGRKYSSNWLTSMQNQNNEPTNDVEFFFVPIHKEFTLFTIITYGTEKVMKSIMKTFRF